MNFLHIFFRIFRKSNCFCRGDNSEVRLLVLAIESFLLISKVVQEKIELYFFHFTDSCFGLNICPFSKYSQDNLQNE